MTRHIVFELSEKVNVLVEALAAKTGMPASRIALAKACQVKVKSLTSNRNDGKISMDMEARLAKTVGFDASHFSWIDRNIPAHERHLPRPSKPRRDTAAEFRNYLFRSLGLDDSPHVTFPAMPGEQVSLTRLANLDVAAPKALKGANAVHAELNRRQPIGLSVKPIFGTLREEELYDPDGKLLAIADIEAVSAYIMIETSDPYVEVLAGMGVDGEELVIGTIVCRYQGRINGRVQFEIMAVRTDSANRTTLAGTSQTLSGLVDLEGVFDEDDWIGIGIDRAGLDIVKLSLISGDEDVTSGRLSLESQIKRQVLKQGIELMPESELRQDVRLAAKWYFMKRILEGLRENNTGATP